jgi:hypothetical protein
MKHDSESEAGRRPSTFATSNDEEDSQSLPTDFVPELQGLFLLHPSPDVPDDGGEVQVE